MGEDGGGLWRNRYESMIFQPSHQTKESFTKEKIFSMMMMMTITISNY